MVVILVLKVSIQSTMDAERERALVGADNRYMLDHLRQKLKIPAEKLVWFLENVGNTVSSTIPLALEHAAAQGQFRPGQRLFLAGFGVGYSWGAALLQWPGPGN